MIPPRPLGEWLAGHLGDLLAAGAGALAPLAFAPFGLWPLAILAPALLFLSWEGSTPRRALLRGWLFGLGMFGVGVSWVHYSIHQYGGAPLPLAIAIAALLILFLALFPAALGWASRRWGAALSAPARLLGLLPAGWLLAEWVRGWLLSGFPWLNLGYALIDAPLAGLAPLAGVYGVGWAVTLTAGALALLRRQGSAAWQPLAAVALLWIAAFALRGHAWCEPAGEPISVALLQGNIDQELKWKEGELEQTLAIYDRMTRAAFGARLIVWPETALPTFYHRERYRLQGLARAAKLKGSDLLIGAPVWEGRDRYFNAILNPLDPAGFYYKRHLVPFGEYLPLRPLLGELLRLLEIPMADFSEGTDDQPPITAAGHPIGASICYEAAFGEELIDALPAAQLLLNVSNDAWFGDTLAPPQHLEIARMRALESGRYLLRATNNGISAIIGPDGGITARSPQFERYTLKGEAVPLRGATPYVRVGNGLAVGLGLLVIVITMTLPRHRRNH
ncbi:apolipoprotein N-acyltransferase [Endothiovibrio diazotrophicus]